MKFAHAAALAAIPFALSVSSIGAQAHSTLEISQATIGAGYKGVVRVPHGCNGEATQTLRVSIPDEIANVKPMPKPGWTLTIRSGPYASPFNNHGKVMHEGVKEIVWSGGALQDAHYDEFVFTGTIIPGAKAGTIYVPVIQECANGAEKWVETPPPHDANARLKYPAPQLVLVQAAQAQTQAHNAPSGSVYTIGSLRIEAPWTRATPKGAQVGGGYLKITNTGKEADRLVGGSLPIAGRFEVHEMATVDGVMKMRHLPQGVEIKPGASVELKPGGYHLMFMQLKESLVAGKPIKGTLVFEKAGTVEVEYLVAPIGAREMPAAGGDSHH